MSAFRFPTVFLSHGTPMHAFGDDSYSEMLHRFSNSIPKPKAVLVISTHSVSDNKIHILRSSENWIQHDFNGFPKELYQVQYACPGDPALAENVSSLFQ